MLDPIPILRAMAVAAVIAATALLLTAWPWRSPHPVRASLGALVGIGIGFFVGCWLLGVHPHWPPREDQDRLLLLLFPIVFAVELLALFLGRMRWLAWPARLLIATGAARLLLHDSSYVTDLSGPGTQEWTATRAWFILGGLAVMLAGVWLALVVLARRTSGRTLSLTLALAASGTAITVMLSGYASGGQLGLPLGAALMGSVLASLLLRASVDATGIVGVGVVGLFTLAVIGRFFGELTTLNAALLFLAPLLGWLSELPYVCRVGPRLRSVCGLVLAALPVIVALVLAQQKFAAESGQTSPGVPEPSIQDYLDFGK
jgi:hypothetical protein